MNPRRAIDKDTFYITVRSAIRHDEDPIINHGDRWFTTGIVVFLVLCCIFAGVWLA